MARPSKYQPDFTRQAYHLALLGATDVEIATALGVTDATVHVWKKRRPEFRDALKRGKEEADAKVAQSLYRRATGYSHKAVKIFADPKTGSEKIVPYVEKYPPDTVACIFWLKNRRPDIWRDKHNVEHTGEVKGTGVLAIPVPATDQQWATAAMAQQAELAGTKPPLVS